MSEHTVGATYETFPNKKNNKVYVTISTTEPIGFAPGTDGGGEGSIVECDENTEALRLAADGLIKEWIRLNVRP